MAKPEEQISGSVDLQVDAQAISATLHIAQHPAGQPWSAESISALLKRKGVANPVGTDALRRRIEEAAREDETEFTIVAAEGLPAEAGTPERAEFGDIAIPAELAGEAERVLAGAGNPEIIVKRTRKIQRQKTQTIKSKLPFGRPKQKRVVVTETETYPERVYVDPALQQTAYVEAEQRIGRVQPQKSGTPGRNVYGMVVHPKAVADPLFYCGNGIQRRGEELVATTTGFLRVGSNWADIVDYAPHGCEVTLSDDQATCFADFTPGSATAPLPDAASLLQQAVELGFESDQLIAADELARQLADAAERRATERIPLTASRDASFDVQISEDRLTAVINLSKGKGRGKPLVLKEVGHAIASQGLARLDQKRIQQDILAFYRSSETDLIGYVLAEGTAAGEGPPREPEFSFRPLPETQQHDLVRSAREDPRALEGVTSLDEFPIDAVTQMALVDREQRLVTVPPAVEGSAGSDVFGKAIKGAAAPEPPIKLLDNLAQTGTVVISRIDGVLDRGEINGVTMLRVRPHRDAEIGVTVTQDRMKAYLSLCDGVGSGRRIDEAAVNEALERHSVRHGLKPDVLKAAVRSAMEGERISNLLVAEGTPAENPSEQTFELLVQPVSQSAVTIRDDGSADYRNQQKMRTVTAETPLARILPQPAQARPGTDVSGAAVPPVNRPNALPQVGAFVRRDEQQDGSVLLVAEREGDFIYEGSRLEVRVEYSVNGDVDLASGNIRFPGSVSISGSVGSGFVVIAGGDITVGETVEASLLSADGRILVRQGVKGAGKGVLRSKSVIGTGFAEQAALLSVGDVTVNSGALHCTIKTNGRVVVQKDRGGIVGGTVRARHGVATSNLGSPNGLRTSVSFGQDYLIADQIEKEEKQIETIKQRIGAVDLSMRKDDLNAQAIEDLRREKKLLLKTMEKRSLRLFTLRERFEEHHEATIAVRGTVHPGVTLESHGRKIDISSERKNVIFRFDETTGRVIEQPIDQAAAHRKADA